MSVEIIYEPTTLPSGHNCELPPGDTFPLGTIAKCDECGTEWKRFVGCARDGESYAAWRKVRWYDAKPWRRFPNQ